MLRCKFLYWFRQVSKFGQETGKFRLQLQALAFPSTPSNIIVGFCAPFPTAMVFHCPLYTPSLHLCLPHLLPPEWKAISAVDWRMMLLLRESLHQRQGRRVQGESEREKLRRKSGSLGRYSCDGWAVKRPIVQITQRAPCHHPRLIYVAVQYGTDIALSVESLEDMREVVKGFRPNTFWRRRTQLQTHRHNGKPQLASCCFCIYCLFASRPQWQVSIWMRSAAVPSCPPTACCSYSLMHKDFTTVFKAPIAYRSLVLD